MKPIYGLGAVLIGIAAAVPAPHPAAAASPFDGNYRGTFDLSPSGLSTQNAYHSKCVDRRAAAMTIRDGNVYIEYANWKGHKLHYRGKVDGAGAVMTYHTNGDGTRAELTGRIDNNVLTGSMRRDDCSYTVNLRRT